MNLLGTSLWLWMAFGAIVIALLAFDLGVLHRREQTLEVRESLWLSAGYIGVALAFAAWLGWYQGSDSGMAFLTGYLIEKTLSLDNVFLISAVFAYLAVPRQHQHKVLFWGILGVIVSRALIIGLGTALVSQFAWVLYLFGIFLIFTGVRMFVRAEVPADLEANPVTRWMRRHLRITTRFHGNRFWVKAAPDDAAVRGVALSPTSPAAVSGPTLASAAAPRVWSATPLFLALMLIEALDVIFAVDSVPAILAITQDPFIVYTSNIFAILGLRALYFCLAILMARFHYLKYALAAVLVFVGGKILIGEWVGKPPVWVSLSVTLGLLVAGVLYSLYRTSHRTSNRWRPPSRGLS
jgi:tellurite resistance protein TerC